MALKDVKLNKTDVKALEIWVAGKEKGIDREFECWWKCFPSRRLQTASITVCIRSCHEAFPRSKEQFRTYADRGCPCLPTSSELGSSYGGGYSIKYVLQVARKVLSMHKK